MDLSAFRKDRGLTLEATATELGLEPSSKGWLSEIENWQQDKTKGRPASLKLAMKIERWSGGKVPASSLSEIAAEVAGQRGAA